MTNRAFVEKSLLDSILADQNLVLDKATSHRFVNILRLKSGDCVELFDGTGRIVKGNLDLKGPASLNEISTEVAKEQTSKIVLIQALIKMDKLEQVVQRNTELGIDEIVFFSAERSQFNFKDKAAQKIERLNKIAQDAARQSQRTTVPFVRGVYSFADLSKIVDEFPGLKVMGELGAATKFIDLLQNEKDQIAKNGIAIIVGPEGGISPAELSSLKRREVKSAIWNSNVLRSETAGMAAAALVNASR